MIKGPLIYVFVRLKPSEHCLLVNLKTNRHNVKWYNTTSMIIEMSKGFYECDRAWLITHPSLSCYTEINIIKLKETKKE